MICDSSDCWDEADSELFYVTTSGKPRILAYCYCPKHYTSKLWTRREWNRNTPNYFETRPEAEAELVSRILLYATLS